MPDPEADSPPAPLSLCLSGGGYRAAAYHLGALRRLHENGLLAQVDTLSSVSGGSILAAHMAQVLTNGGRTRLVFDDFESEVAAPFRRQILTNDIRTVPFLKQWVLPWNWFRSGPAAMALTHQYERHLTRLRLEELPAGVEFLFCATDLLYGIDWRFRRETSGDAKANWHSELSTLGVAQAVAASSCFPPIFLPMKIQLPKGRQTETGQTTVQLSDGGVYDNLGLRAVWRESKTVLVSDGGAPFDYREGSTPLSRLARYAAIASHHVDKLNWQWLFSRIRRESLFGTTWRIGGASRTQELPGYTKDTASEAIAKIRTDMDGFSSEEIHILENHGYAGAAQRTEKYLAERLDPARPVPVLPHADVLDEAIVRSVLANSWKRRPLRSLLRLLKSPWTPFRSRLGAAEAGA